MEGNDPMMNQMPSESSVRRNKIIWRVFLITNFALGAYMLAKPTAKKERVKKEKTETPPTSEAPPTPSTVSPPPPEEPEIIPPPIIKRVIIRDPIPEDQQREIFKWILEEKRKVKPQNKEEKKRIDEEKAILKQFIRSESIPKI